MNYSTIKTAAVCLLISVFGLTEVAKAQEPTVFGGRSQYRTWSIGVNGGIHLPTSVFGPGGSPLHNGIDDPWDYDKVREFYGIQVRKQFSNWFGLQADVTRGRVMGWNKEVVPGASFQSAVADFQYAASLNGVFQLATIDFLRRKNVVNFFATAGLGYNEFTTTLYSNNDGSGSVVSYNGQTEHKDCDLFVPVGIGVKFKLSDRVALNLGHTMYIMSSNELYGVPTGRKNRYSNVYGGLEFSLGSKDKADLTWHNPVAMLYDELKDESLRNELEALKQRVSTLEGTVDVLNADADGDGVSDRFDKCPNTPAGTPVDGSGCPIEFPEPVIQEAAVVSYPNIQFEFDSSVLKTESYSTLDKLSSELRSSGNTVTLEGHASAEGSESYNLTLSKDRANSVKTYLVNSGVAADKVITNGYGEDRPIASNATEEGRVQNRRVEIKR